ncbi:MAG: histidine phosphatase family protein [Pseudomonadota bacterium]
MAKTYPQKKFQPPSGHCDILLIRHGASEPAVEGQSFAMKDGQGDPALAPDGEAQAEAVARRLRDEPIEAIYVTTLRRTHQTAAPLAAALAMTPRVEPRLREIHLGAWDGGHYRAMAHAGHPLYRQAMETGEWGHIPGAETTGALRARVEAGLVDIAARHPDQMVAVFAHGGSIGAALEIITQARPFSMIGSANGAISRVVMQGDHRIFRGFNDCAHL